MKMATGMPSKVEDPDLLKQLNGGKVTDPAILSQLNGNEENLQPRTFGESMSDRAKTAMAQEPGDLAHFVRRIAFGVDPITPLSKAYGVASAPFGAAGETIERNVGKKLGVEPQKLEKAARDTGDVTSGLLQIIPGGRAAKAAEEVQEAGRLSFIQKLVTPKVTKSVAENQVSRTTESGILRNKVVAPLPREKAIADEVAKLPVNRTKSLQANYNVIAAENTREAQALEKTLKQKDVEISFDNLQKTIDETKSSMKKTYLGSNWETGANRIIEQMNESILKNAIKNGKITASGLWDARKDFDATVKAQKAKIFDRDTYNSYSEAARDMRQAINNLIEKSIPDAKFKASMKKQSLLFDAMDNIEPKAASEGSNIITRNLSNPVLNYIRKALGK